MDFWLLPVERKSLAILSIEIPKSLEILPQKSLFIWQGIFLLALKIEGGKGRKKFLKIFKKSLDIFKYL